MNRRSFFGFIPAALAGAAMAKAASAEDISPVATNAEWIGGVRPYGETIWIQNPDDPDYGVEVYRTVHVVASVEWKQS